MEDLQARRIRIIGQPDRRYREDPVRMLLVVRFAAKLQFDLESKTTEPIADLADLILNVRASSQYGVITSVPFLL